MSGQAEEEHRYSGVGLLVAPWLRASVVGFCQVTSVLQAYAVCLPTSQGKPEPKRLSYREIVATLGLETPDMLLHRGRLWLFIRLVVRRPPKLLDSLMIGLGTRRSWLSAIHDDLSFIAKH